MAENWRNGREYGWEYIEPYFIVWNKNLSCCTGRHKNTVQNTFISIEDGALLCSEGYFCSSASKGCDMVHGSRV